MPQTIRAGAAIERMKAQVVHLSSPGRGSGSGPGSGAEINLPRIRELLLEIGRREALADFEHVAAHRECLELLTPSQRLHLKRLLARDSSP